MAGTCLPRSRSPWATPGVASCPPSLSFPAPGGGFVLTRPVLRVPPMPTTTRPATCAALALAPTACCCATDAMPGSTSTACGRPSPRSPRARGSARAAPPRRPWGPCPPLCRPRPEAFFALPTRKWVFCWTGPRPGLASPTPPSLRPSTRGFAWFPTARPAGTACTCATRAAILFRRPGPTGATSLPPPMAWPGSCSAAPRGCPLCPVSAPWTSPRLPVRCARPPSGGGCARGVALRRSPRPGRVARRASGPACGHLPLRRPPPARSCRHFPLSRRCLRPPPRPSCPRPRPPVSCLLRPLRPCPRRRRRPGRPPRRALRPCGCPASASAPFLVSAPRGAVRFARGGAWPAAGGRCPRGRRSVGLCRCPLPAPLPGARDCCFAWASARGPVWTAFRRCWRCARACASPSLPRACRGHRVSRPTPRCSGTTPSEGGVAPSRALLWGGRRGPFCVRLYGCGGVVQGWVRGCGRGVARVRGPWGGGAVGGAFLPGALWGLALGRGGMHLSV